MVFIRYLSALGLLNAVLLTLSQLSGTNGCLMGGATCDVVLTSPYSKIFSIPLSGVGVSFFGLLVLLSRRPADPGEQVDRVKIAFLLSVSGSLVSLVLVGIQATILHAWCPGCLFSSAICSLILIAGFPQARRVGFRPLLPARMPFAYDSVLFVLTAPSLIFLLHGAMASDPSTSMESDQSSATEPSLEGPGGNQGRLLQGPESGSGSAHVVVFSDFECHHCQAAHFGLKEALLPYADAVRVEKRYVYRKPKGETAAIAVYCADEQGKRREYEDLIFVDQDRLNDPFLRAQAAALGLDLDRFGRCLAAPEAKREVDDNVRLAKQIGIRALPTIVVNGRAMTGWRRDEFVDVVEAALGLEDR